MSNLNYKNRVYPRFILLLELYLYYLIIILIPISISIVFFVIPENNVWWWIAVGIGILVASGYGVWKGNHIKKFIAKINLEVNNVSQLESKIFNKNLNWKYALQVYAIKENNKGNLLSTFSKYINSRDLRVRKISYTVLKNLRMDKCIFIFKKRLEKEKFFFYKLQLISAIQALKPSNFIIEELFIYKNKTNSIIIKKMIDRYLIKLANKITIRT